MARVRRNAHLARSPRGRLARGRAVTDAGWDTQCLRRDAGVRVVLAAFLVVSVTSVATATGALASEDHEPGAPTLGALLASVAWAVRRRRGLSGITLGAGVVSHPSG